MNAAEPLFTVATISYNSENWIRQTIESVLGSSFTDFEFLISDDCSSDNTWAIIRQYSDPRIRAWRNDSNIGEYPNRNKVLNETRGKYILYIDGDDILYKDSLERFANYAAAFPQAAGIWGVTDMYFDFVVFPYLFEPAQLIKLIYFSSYPVSIIGFAESLFSTSVLKEIGGFHTGFAMGDIFIKKRIACTYPVLLTTRGYTFWRQTSNQASKKVTKDYANLVENYVINDVIVHGKYFPLTEEERATAEKNINISVIKLIVKNTLLKGRFITFMRLMKRVRKPYSDLKLLFSRIYLGYTCNASGDAPLMNTYNIKSNTEKTG